LTGHPHVEPATTPKRSLPDLNFSVADDTYSDRPNRLKRIVLLKICRIQHDVAVQLEEIQITGCENGGAELAWTA
jgi:hypothetical protein